MLLEILLSRHTCFDVNAPVPVRRKTENAKPSTRLFMNFTRESVTVSVRMPWERLLSRGVESRRVLRYRGICRVPVNWLPILNDLQDNPFVV